MSRDRMLFEAFAKVLTEGTLAEPEAYPPALRNASRADVRRGIMWWLAEQKAQGMDLLRRTELLPGKWIAPREAADQAWQFSRIFAPGKLAPEERAETREAARHYDRFNQMLDTLAPSDPDYWPKVRAFLAQGTSWSDRPESAEERRLRQMGWLVLAVAIAMGAIVVVALGKR